MHKVEHNIINALTILTLPACLNNATESKPSMEVYKPNESKNVITTCIATSKMQDCCKNFFFIPIALTMICSFSSFFVKIINTFILKINATKMQINPSIFNIFT